MLTTVLKWNNFLRISKCSQNWDTSIAIVSKHGFLNMQPSYLVAFVEFFFNKFKIFWFGDDLTPKSSK
jgi:hypothetical protein